MNSNFAPVLPALVHSDAQRLVESVADRKALEDAYAASAFYPQA
ncbi:hypothetical protein [Corynebacterium argentoratense]|nr:hypothetical protein [Corynebacterium argentoratense]